MAKKTRTELSTSAINTNLPDNTQELITPTTERAQLTDERESVVNYKDDLGGTGNAGKFLTVATDGESLTMVDEPSGVPDWVTFITAVRNQMLLKAGGDGTGTTEAWLKFTSYDGATTAQINFNGIDGSLYINGSQSQIQLTSQISFIIGGTPRLVISSGGDLSTSDGTFTMHDGSGSPLAFKGKSSNGGSEIDWYANNGTTRIGYLEIAQTAASKLNIETANDFEIYTNSTKHFTIGSSGYLIQNASQNGSAYIQLQNQGTTLGYLGNGTSLTSDGTTIANELVLRTDSSLSLNTSGTTRMRISSGGVVSIPNGIIFNNNTTGGTPNATGVTLNDYEEGTWTPTLVSSVGTLTSYTSSGTYTRVGRFVELSIEFTITDNGTAASVLYISNIPFAMSNTTTASGSGVIPLLGTTLNVWHYTGAYSIGMYTYSGSYAGSAYNTRVQIGYETS